LGPDYVSASLAAGQAAVVAALVADGPVPPGFSADLVRATREALLRKRAGEVAHMWPLLAASFGTQWTARFAEWAAGRPPAGSLRDGWDLARSLGSSLAPLGSVELATREARWRYDGTRAPRRRRIPAVVRVNGARAVQVLGRVHAR
jgi:hypothetical protein